MTLRQGSRSPDVLRLKQLLVGQGYGRGVRFDDRFDAVTRTAVEQFQAGHVGQDGRPLAVDGVAGPNTRWALEHPSGPDQRDLADDAVGGVPPAATPDQRRVLECALADVGLKEEPDGSNDGPGIRKFTDGARVPWCALACSYWIRTGLDRTKAFPPFRARASALKIRDWGRANGCWYPEKPSFRPLPADVFVILRAGAGGVDTGRGHVGFVIEAVQGVLRTIEGNAGNAVRLRVRERAGIQGYVRVV